jgi:hypothetical protein
MDTYQQKISHLKALYHLAAADNDLSKVELVYIKHVAERLAIPLDAIKGFSSTEPDLELPDKEYKIYAIFHRLAIIIMVDNAASEKEKQYCFNLGIKMGLHPNAIGEVIEHIIEKGPMNAMPLDIVKIFYKYQS